jgi:hypothetical protein
MDEGTLSVPGAPGAGGTEPGAGAGGTEPGAGAGGTPGAPGNGAPAAEAFGFLPDGLQSLAQGYDKPEAFWADVSRLKGLDAEAKALGGLTVNGLVSEEQQAAAWKALGRPADAAGYSQAADWKGNMWDPGSEDGRGAEAPAAVAAEVSRVLKADDEQWRRIMHMSGVTEQQSVKLREVYGSLMARHMAAAQAARAEYEPEKVMTELWPQDKEAHLDTARRGARAAGLGAELDDAGLSGHPLVLKLCHALGEAVAEDRVAGLGGTGALLPTGAAAKEELHRVVGSDAYKTGDKAAIRMAETLSARVHLK